MIDYDSFEQLLKDDLIEAFYLTENDAEEKALLHAPDIIGYMWDKYNDYIEENIL